MVAVGAGIELSASGYLACKQALHLRKSWSLSARFPRDNWRACSKATGFQSQSLTTLHAASSDMTCQMYLKNFNVLVSQIIKLCVGLIQKLHDLHWLSALITIMSEINNSTEHDGHQLIFFSHDGSL